MKIAVVCPYSLDHPGGVQNQAIQLVDWLRSDDHEAWLVAPGDDGGPTGTMYLGRAVRVRANRSLAPVLLRPGTGARVERAIAGADVVHVHEPFMPLVSVAAVRTATAPVVGTFHADPGRGVRSIYRVARPLFGRLVSGLAVATAVSPLAARGVASLVASVRIVPNGIDVASYRRVADRSSKRVAFLGRDDPRKGLDVLLQAWPTVRRSIPGAELLVLGADRAPRDGVTFLGRVDEEMKRLRLATAGVFAAPNLGGESFGLVVAEAMAAGCAVVASSIPAFVDVVGEAGVLVAPGDSNQLALALTRMIEAPGTQDALREAGYARVRAFDRREVLAGYLQAYRAAVEESG